MKKLLALAITVVFILAASPCWGEIPHLINYQGMLTNDEGEPLNGSFNLTFRIFDDPDVGNQKWGETQNNIPVENGLFSVILGSADPIDLPFDEDYWLEIEVGILGPLSPRIRLTSVPYAFRAKMADTAYVAVGGSADLDDRYVNSSGPDSVTGSVGGTSYLFSVKNSSGRGIYIESPSGYRAIGTTGQIKVDESLGGHAFSSDSCSLSGLAVNKVGLHGVDVVRAGSNGLLVQEAGEDGVKIDKAGQNGVHIVNADSNGIYIDSIWAGFPYAGIYMRKIGWDGIRIHEAQSRGIYVEKALYGIVAYANYGSNLFSTNPSNYGLSVYANAQDTTKPGLKVKGSTDLRGDLTVAGKINGIIGVVAMGTYDNGTLQEDLNVDSVKYVTNHYEIFLTGITYHYRNYITIVTPVGGDPYMVSATSGSGKLLVYFHDKDGNAVQNNYFHFVVYNKE